MNNNMWYNCNEIMVKKKMIMIIIIKWINNY